MPPLSFSVYPVVLVMLGMAALACLSPAAIPRLLGQATLTPSARNEVRAVYGGVGLGAAACLLWAPAAYAPGVLFLLLAMMGAMATLRMLDFALHRHLPPWPLAFVGLELGLIACLAWALWGQTI